MVKALYPVTETAVTELEGACYMSDSVGRAASPSPGSQICMHSELELQWVGKYPLTTHLSDSWSQARLLPRSRRPDAMGEGKDFCLAHRSPCHAGCAHICGTAPAQPW